MKEVENIIDEKKHGAFPLHLLLFCCHSSGIVKKSTMRSRACFRSGALQRYDGSGKK